MANNSSLIGRWKSVDPWDTEVHFEISQTGTTYDIRVVDGSDGEVAEVYEIKFDANVLTFGALWSSGQFTKYRLKRLGHHIEAVFTYNGTSHFEREE